MIAGDSAAAFDPDCTMALLLLLRVIRRRRLKENELVDVAFLPFPHAQVPHTVLVLPSYPSSTVLIVSFRLMMQVKMSRERNGRMRRLSPRRAHKKVNQHESHVRQGMNGWKLDGWMDEWTCPLFLSLSGGRIRHKPRRVLGSVK